MSQQSSPRRSLIPQPTRQRSTSLSKSTERLSSPKLGRRTDSRGRLTDSRNRLNASGNSSSVASLASRRQAARTPSKLSPIQGTPTKPERTPTQSKRDRSGGKESAPARQQKFAVSPSRHNAWNAKKQEKAPVSGGKTGGSKERVTSPSKIPLKTNRVGSNSSSSSNPSRFITISNQPKGKKGADKGGSKGVGASDETSVNESGQDGGKRSETEPRAGEKSAERIPDLHLIDLLKQTSTATGTSSVVSTTATTAVQPLHIDANAILLDKDGLEKKSLAERSESQERSKSQKNSLSENKSSNSPNPDDSKQIHNSQHVEDHHHPRHANSQISRSNRSNGNYGRAKGGVEGRNDSPIPNDAASNHQSKGNGTGQSAKSKGNGAAMGNADSTIQRSNNKMSNDPKNCRPNDTKMVEESVAFQPVVSNSSSKASEVESSKDSARNSSSTEKGTGVVSGGSVKQEEARTISRSSDNSGTRVAANAPVKSTPVSDRSSVSSKANNNGLASNDANKVKSAAGGKVGNEGSGTSLKSSGGVSVDSIESVRSTDTGVSVDTVRGVSSPREKTGMHVVKRAQEIETLSGNVVHLEQNGEPA